MRNAGIEEGDDTGCFLLYSMPHSLVRACEAWYSRRENDEAHGTNSVGPLDNRGESVYLASPSTGLSSSFLDLSSFLGRGPVLSSFCRLRMSLTISSPSSGVSLMNRVHSSASFVNLASSGFSPLASRQSNERANRASRLSGSKSRSRGIL